MNPQFNAEIVEVLHDRFRNGNSILSLSALVSTFDLSGDVDSFYALGFSQAFDSPG